MINKIKARTSERNDRSDESDIAAPPSVPEPDTPPTNTADIAEAKGERTRNGIIVIIGVIATLVICLLLAEHGRYLRRYFTHGNTSTSSHLNDGITSAIYGQYFEAISHYDLAIKDDPSDDQAYYWRGKAKAELNQHPAAIIDYNKALRLNPFDGAAYADRGWSKYRLKRYTDALKRF